MKKRLFALLLALALLVGLLPAAALAAGETEFADFFTDLSGIAEVTNDESYPYTVDTETADGPWLKSSSDGQGSTEPAVTLKFTQAAALSFAWVVSSEERYDGMQVKNGDVTLYTYSTTGSSGEVTGCSGEKSGAATVYAKAGDIITIAYHKDGSGDNGSDCLWLKNFAWAPVYDLTFTVTPSAADFALYSDAVHTEALTPNSGTTYTYTLENGTYYWAASAFGHEATSGSVTLDGAAQTVPVTLTAESSYGVTFSYGELGGGEAIQNGNLIVTTSDGQHTMEPTTTGGLAYALPVGHDYTWTFQSANYARQNGEILLSAETAEGTRNISIPLSLKTAWEGAGDIIQPQQIGGVYQISSGGELAWLAQEVNAGRGADYRAVLTADIDLGGEPWTPIGKSGYGYSWAGTFDGQNHTISGLKVSSSTYDQGLFGYVNGGTIKDLAVRGEVSGGGTSNSGGVGGIVGTLSSPYSTASLVQNCISYVKVSGGNNVGGIVGCVIGSYDKRIENCANYGEISGSNSVGGLVGNFYNKGQLLDSYNRGMVTAAVSKAGGLVGYMSSSSASVSNCYTTGAVTGNSSAPAIGQKDSGTVSNLYYLDTLGTDANATARTDGAMKAAGFPGELGDAFSQDMAVPVNDGYPIFAFQDTTPKYDVVFTVTPANAAVTLTDVEGAAIAGNRREADGKAVWTFQLRDGTYRYEASAFGKQAEPGTLTVNGGAESRTITLTDAPSARVRLDIGYSDGNPTGVAPTVTVIYAGDGREMTAENGVYTLPYGDYSYTVKAKGYAKAEGSLTANAAEQTVSISLTVSAAWDGESQEEPAKDGDVYQISSGAELAWFADQVNSGAGKSYSSVLTGDIDLGENPWTPIGNSSSCYFAGAFDGGGYTVSGLYVADAQYAGLFGYAKGTSGQSAAIRNVVVQGSISSTSSGDAGGIVARADYTSIENCGNEAAVSGSYAGGIVARQFSYGSPITIANSYSSGNVIGVSRAGGIVGYVNDQATVTNCYNTGDVTATNGYSGGIRGSSGTFAGDTANCYHTGSVTGKTSGPILSGSGSAVNCFYLDAAVNDQTGSTAKTSEELKNIVADLNNGADPAVWVSGGSQNSGYPVLAWQAGGSGETGGPLNTVTNAVWRADANGLLTGVATWDSVPNAESYTVVLWDYWTRETDTGAEMGLSSIRTATGVTGTEYDFTADIEANGTSWYYFTVTPIAAADSGYESGAVPQTEAAAWAAIDLSLDGACYRYMDQLPAPTGLRWMGHMASWSFVDDAFGYLVMVYRVDDNNYASYVAGGIVSGSANALDCRNYFAVGGRYVFSVMALSEEYVVTGIADKNSPESELSSHVSNGGTQYGIYTAESVPAPDPDDTDRSDWIPISTAHEWIELANVESKLLEDLVTDQQSVEWGKKYYLTADLDFSGLSAEDAAKTKSIGNTTNRFTGILDGNGHKITGLTLSNYDAGLFAYIGASGQVYDLTIEAANVLFSDNAAVLALNNYGTIRDCAVINCNITADTGAVLGGLVSRNYGLIQESYVQGGTLTSNSQTATGHAGFVGANEGGGIIERCWSSMDVNTQSDYSGGFVGLGYGGTIRDCFALGSVSARGYSGGFAGRSVYSGNVYENCYAAGIVAVTDEAGHGFIGGSKPDSAFQPDLSAELRNCYYNAASLADDYADGRTLSEMQSPDFLLRLGGTTSSAWAQDTEQNGGLPYLRGVSVPAGMPTSDITVEIALATYDKSAYAFSKLGGTVTVTMASNGNTRVVDIMDAAVSQGVLTYSYETTPTFGRFIHTINGYAVDAPDGWMFTVNDALSNVSASLATVEDGDKLLWFEGTTENRFLPPAWDSLAGESVQWEEIASIDDLLALANSTDDQALARNYRLAGGLDLTGVSFSGIGSAAHPFTGMFDGQGNTISGVTVSGGENAGFFNVIKGATIKNLHLTGVTVTGTKHVGGLVGWAQAELDSTDLAQNVACLVGNCTVSGAVSGVEAVGGLVGCNDGKYDRDTLFSISSAIDKSSADVAVTASGNGSKIGGLVGENNGTITKSAAAGDVDASSATTVGGFVGDSTGDIYDSHALGDVSGKSTVGGFAGYSDGAIERCYSLGTVTGSGITGSFAGTIYAAEFVIGAGQVTVGDPSSSYNAGFAGQLSGEVAGLVSRVTVKNAYGNCVQSAGSAALNAVGNSFQFQSEAQKAALAEMGLVTNDAVSAKLFEMFGVNLKGSEGLQAEAEKYANTVFVANDVAAGAVIDLLRQGQTASDDITATVTADSTYLASGAALTLAKANDTATTLQLPIILALTDSTGNVYRKTVTVMLQAHRGAVGDLVDAIAATLTGSSDGWALMDMAAYQSLGGRPHATTEEARQNALNLLITEVAGSSATLRDRTRLELVLRSMGIDSTRLYTVNSNTAIDNAAKLAAQNTPLSSDYFDASWLLLAELQGNFDLTNDQIARLIDLLKANMGDGLFGYTWNGVTYSDPDTAGAALAALARFYDSSADAREVVDAILTAIPGALDATGSLGNANSDAMVITGLVAMGKDPRDFCNTQTGASLVDGLLSWVNASGDGFLYGGTNNFLATEQGFRALVALAGFDGTSPYNLYDFSGKTVEPGRATGAGQVDPIPEPDTDKTIRVTLMLKTDTEVWIPRTTVTVKEGSTVYHAFVKALADAGDMSAVGAENGYVKSITKNGVTLAEFGKGENAGWLYKINGQVPDVGLTSYVLSEGDDILWYYTLDWTQEQGFAGGSKPAEEAGLPFTDVEGHWGYDAILYAYENGLMNGAGDTLFDPDGTLTRAMLVTILYRLEGEPNVTAENPFADVADGAWYTTEVIWASENGIVRGVSDSAYAPNDDITREQMAAMLYRYAQYRGYDVSRSADLNAFSDLAAVHAWALAAMQWANAEGLVTGRTATTLVPDGTATRAEAAMILMRFIEGVAEARALPSAA